MPRYATKGAGLGIMEKLQGFVHFDEGQQVQTINLAGIVFLSSSLEISRREALLLALEQDVWPLRFLRNKGTLSAAEQIKLLQSHVLVVGCGGLGGYVGLLLARLGIGRLTLCDNDIFEESNLNRQIHCKESCLGLSKAAVLAEEISGVASHVEVISHNSKLTAENVNYLLQGAELVVDCLDNIETRSLLAEAAKNKNIAFVHGALAGHEGFAMFCKEGQDAFGKLYKQSATSGQDSTGLQGVATGQGFRIGQNSPKTAEKKLGTPTLTPPLIAILQTSLVVQALLAKDSTFGNEILLWHADAYDLSLESFTL